MRRAFYLSFASIVISACTDDSTTKPSSNGSARVGLDDGGEGDGDSGGDGSGSSGTDADADGVTVEDGDCDDADPANFPGNPEVCDGADNNCDGNADEGVTTTFYADTDGDTFGDPDRPQEDCEVPSGYVEDNTDCDDDEETSFPGNPEVCDDLDNNCDDDVDEGVTTTYYADVDGDSFGDATHPTEACSLPSGYVEDSTDCDDSDADVNPDATEICDGVDTDCDSSTSEAGMVTFTDPSGATSEFTSSFTGDVTLTDDGTYTVCDGTWTVLIDVEANVVLQSGRGATTTILDGNDDGTVVDIDNGYTVSIDGLTIINGASESANGGFGDSGAGVFCDRTGTLSVSNSVFTGHRGQYTGGAISSEGCDLTVSDTTFDGNSARYGGDIFFWDGTLELSGVTSTGASAYAGSFAYLFAYTDSIVTSLRDSSIDGGSGDFGAIHLYTFSSFENELTCTDSALINHVSTSGSAVHVPSASSTMTGFSCDLGSAASGNDNTNDINTLSGGEYTYDDASWFTCTGDGCEDYAVYEGATGTAKILYGLSTAPDTYTCAQSWDIVATGTSDICTSCDFSFEASWSLDTSTLIDSPDCMSLPSTDLSRGIGFATDSYYGDPVLYLSYAGSWYSWAYADVTAGTLTSTYGSIDAPYDDYGSVYYATNYRSLVLELY